MSFNAKNPLSAPVVSSCPPSPPTGARGLFVTKDGWHDIDDKGNVNKLATSADLSKVATSGDYNDLRNTPAFMYDIDDDGVIFITSDVLPDGDGVNY